ncbi:MAG: hypothetical protein ABI114_08890 [Rhodanobacter sp.]
MVAEHDAVDIAFDAAERSMHKNEEIVPDIFSGRHIFRGRQAAGYFLRSRSEPDSVFASEKAFFVPSDFASAVGDLKRQGCLSGADATIDLQESHSRYLERRIYKLSATGIRFEREEKQPSGNGRY